MMTPEEVRKIIKESESSNIEKINYFFAEFDSLLKDGIAPWTALMETVESYAYVFHNVQPRDKIIEKLEHALSESLKLQSHYASLLNMYDGGKRIGFDSVEKWMDELRKASKS